ncbi:polysaccharide deacetylase family protein [Nocardioides sp. GXQ0305]|uniref:polysaccharide deacetylase family protein n=1 Tax=Nocardioides sp. GXQ0305 TaxID=3423912 RepID=UPI003D7C61BE
MREALKRGLAMIPSGVASGATLLIYHRVGGGSRDELDVDVDRFRGQLDALADHHVVSLDDAVAGVHDGVSAPRVVLTFDDGFGDVHEHAWPLLRERRLPFTIYLTTGYVGGRMQWEGSTAREQGAPALTWEQLREMVGSGLCTIGNHTHTHVPPDLLSTAELDRCTELVDQELGVVPRHFAYTWGIPVPRLEQELAARFASCATGELGRNLQGVDPMRLARVPVRRTDPLPFFRAKLRGDLLPERLYGGVVAAAKGVGMRG